MRRLGGLGTVLALGHRVWLSSHNNNFLSLMRGKPVRVRRCPATVGRARGGPGKPECPLGGWLNTAPSWTAG